MGSQIGQGIFAMKLTETPTSTISEEASQGSDTGRKYWDAYDVAQRSKTTWHSVLAFFGLRVDRF